MSEFFDQVLWDFGPFSINIGQLSLIILMVGLFISMLLWIYGNTVKKYFIEKEVEPKEIIKIRSKLRFLLLLVLILTFISMFDIDFTIVTIKDKLLFLSFIIEVIIAVKFASVLDWTMNNIFVRRTQGIEHIIPNFKHEELKSQTRKTSGLFRYIVYLYCVMIFIQKFGLDRVIYEKKISDGTFTFQISNIIMAIITLLMANVIIWLITQVSLYRVYKNKNLDEGAQFAINQLVKYVIFVGAFFLAIDHLVSDMKIFYGGAAALLVGIGLGLQQTFNDFFSGLVLLFERTVQVGDVVEMEEKVGRVIKIGLRSSLIETRENVSLLVPNSKLVNNFVVNWTHFNDVVRFEVKVSVAYGSDTELVKNMMIEAIKSNKMVEEFPKPFVRFNDFGDSGLYFSLFFFSRHTMVINNVKSDIRFEIDRLFRENNITIPFPQQDIWIRNQTNPEE